MTTQDAIGQAFENGRRQGYEEGRWQGYEEGKRDAVKHGRWEYADTTHGYYYKCSECGEPWPMDGRKLLCHQTPYCPNCGAKMHVD